MGSAEMQGELWGRAPRDWAELQEPKHVPLWSAMLEAAGVREGSRVFDAGCGSGGASVLAAERGATVSGLDASEPLLEIARERLPGADFRIGDMESLPYPDGAFDAVIAASSLQYCADRIAALRELGRVCAPDGRVVVGLWGVPEQVEYRAVFAAVRDALPEPPPGKGPFELSVDGVLPGLISEAGLEVLGRGEAECPFHYPAFEVFWRANVAAGPLQAALRQVAEEELRERVRNALAAFHGPDGSLAFRNTFQYYVAKP
ncbi:MAG TPA: methyltransferase domain-containing protein [Thermoanaerobaculia bacterium]|nr:methyltransferase domain-containing protein [Thermoanaerobaculia bacterium]